MSPEQAGQELPVIILILQVRKTRLRDVKKLVQGHTASKRYKPKVWLLSPLFHTAPAPTCRLTKDAPPQDSVFTVTALAKGQQKARLLFLSFLMTGKEV